MPVAHVPALCFVVASLSLVAVSLRSPLAICRSSASVLCHALRSRHRQAEYNPLDYPQVMPPFAGCHLPALRFHFFVSWWHRRAHRARCPWGDALLSRVLSQSQFLSCDQCLYV